MWGLWIEWSTGEYYHLSIGTKEQAEKAATEMYAAFTGILSIIVEFREISP